MTQSDRLRRQTLVNELARIEAIERTILQKLGHSPDDLNAALDSLQEYAEVGNRRSSWPTTGQS